MRIENQPMKRIKNIFTKTYFDRAKAAYKYLSIFYSCVYLFFILLFNTAFLTQMFASEAFTTTTALETFTAGTWATKTNARWTFLPREESDSQNPTRSPSMVLLESDFGTNRFTWLQWTPSTSINGLVSDCLRFQVTGDGSGHQLFVRLLVPDGPNHFRYYDNQNQSVRLDFCDQREIILDLSQFTTPIQGNPSSDLAHIVKIELFIRVRGTVKPIHIAISTPQWSHWTESELLDVQKVKEKREVLAAKLKPSIQTLRQLFENKHDTKNKQIKKNISDDDICESNTRWECFQNMVDQWCLDDLERSLEDDNLEALQYAECRKIPELTARLTTPPNLHKKKIIKPLDWNHNPFVCHPITAIRRDFIDTTPPSPEYPRTFPRGERGFHSVKEPWDFRRFAEESAVLAWCVTRPNSPLEDQPELVEPLLSRLELLATQHRDGDYGASRISARGYDPNGNRFALAAALEAWVAWEKRYPNLLPQAWRDEWNTGFDTLIQYQVDEYGLGRISQLAQKPVSQCANQDFMRLGYANMDAVYLRIIDLAIRLWPDRATPQHWQEERRIFQKMLDASLLPDGGIRYLGDENDCPLYHQVVVLQLAAIYRDSQLDKIPIGRKNDVTFSWKRSCDFPEQWEETFLRKTLPYYPLAFEPSGLSEYTTAPDWKRYWSRGDAAAPAILAGLFGNAANQTVSLHCAQVWGYGKGYYATIAADFWKPIVPQPSENSRVTLDRNLGGLRGRFGNWSWVAGKRIPETNQPQEQIKYLYDSRKPPSSSSPIGIEYRFQSTDSNGSNVSRETVIPPFHVGLLLSQPGKTPLPLDTVAEVEVTPTSATDSICQRWTFGETEAVGTISIQPRTSDSPPNHADLPSDRGSAAAGNEQPTESLKPSSSDSTSPANIGAVVRLGFDHELRVIQPNTWQYGGFRIRVQPRDPSTFHDVSPDISLEKEDDHENQARPIETPWQITTQTVPTWAKNRSVGEATEIFIQTPKETQNAPLHFTILIDIVESIH